MIAKAATGVLAAALLATGAHWWPTALELPGAQAVHPAACQVPGRGHPYLKAAYAAVHRHWSQERRPYWCWAMAQLSAESGFDPRARSHAGARGIAQIMGPTAKELGVDPLDAAQAIDGYARYMETLARKWSSPRPETERVELAAASYNAGFGRILQAQRRSHGARTWEEMERYAPRETQDYLRRIQRRWREYTGSEW